MSKVRFVNKKGSVVWLNPTLANNANYIKRHGLSRDEIKAPEDAKPPKEEEVKVEVKVEAPKLETESPKELNFDALKIKYKEVFGKKPHHSWDAEALDEKINEKLKEDN